MMAPSMIIRLISALLAWCKADRYINENIILYIINIHHAYQFDIYYLERPPVMTQSVHGAHVHACIASTHRSAWSLVPDQYAQCSAMHNVNAHP